MGPKRIIYHTFTYQKRSKSELSSVNRGVATLNAISGHDFRPPLGGNSKFIHPPKIFFASFIISTPLLNQKSNQNDSNLSSDKLSFYLVSKNLHLTFKNQTECTGDLICAFLCEPQKACECGQNATLTFTILQSRLLTMTGFQATTRLHQILHPVLHSVLHSVPCWMCTLVPFYDQSMQLKCTKLSKIQF